MTTGPDKPAVGEPASPACSMHQADDAYMGYAAADEVAAFLNELLEAERAGARVTLETARAAGGGPLAELMHDIQHDEARWCGMLSRSLNRIARRRSRAAAGPAPALR